MLNTEEEKKAGRMEELKTEIASFAAGENRSSHEMNEETRTVVDFRSLLKEFRKDKLERSVYSCYWFLWDPFFLMRAKSCR